MMQDQWHRDRDGPPRSWLDATQEAADAALAPAGLRARIPDAVGLLPVEVPGGDEVQALQPQGNAVNGEDSRKLQLLVGGAVYGYIDGPIGPGVTDFTQVLVVENLREPIPVTAGSERLDSPNAYLHQALDAGHGALEATPACE